jgi:branched-chain amino acid transport system permease protein
LTVAASAAGAGARPSVFGRFRSAVAGARGQLALYVILVLALFFFVPSPSLAISALIYGLWAVSVNLLLGYGGLVSFGHALYWGYGGYAAGLLLIHVSDSLWLALLASLLVPGLIAAGAGYVCLRRRDVYFSMLTLAFAQLAYFVAFEARPVTGGDDGLGNIPTPPVALGAVSVPLNAIRDTLTFFVFTAIVVGICFALLLLYTESPLGRVLQAIRESEERARACGYNTRLVQLITFGVSGLFAGLAGGLNAVFNGFVGLDAYWQLSGVVVIMVILGGRSTLFGSMIGATVYLLLQHYLSNVFGEWQLILGAIFVAIVLAFPQGLWGIVRLERVGMLRLLRRRAPA